MSYKVYIYALMLLITAFAFSGINFNNFFKANHKLEANIFMIIMIMAFSFLASQFIIFFIEA